MKTVRLIFLLLLPVAASARIGDTPAGAEKRYGKPVAALPADPVMPEVTARRYKIENLIVTEEYLGGRCEKQTVGKVSRAAFDENELIEVAVINFPDSALAKAGSSKRSTQVRSSEEYGAYLLTENCRVALSPDKLGVIAVTNVYESARERSLQNGRDATAKAGSQPARDALKGL